MQNFTDRDTSVAPERSGSLQGAERNTYAPQASICPPPPGKMAPPAQAVRSAPWSEPLRSAASSLLIAIVFLLLALGGLAARADYATTFSTPPYSIDGTTIGVDGWDYRLPTTADRSETARVVAVRWNDYKPAMVMKGAGLKNTTVPTKGGKVTVTFDLAVTFQDIGGSGKQFRIGFTGAPCGEVFLEMGAEGGLGCQADGSGRGGVVALKRSEVKLNSFYTYTLDIDYAKMTYRISIAGQKKDGSPFRYETENVAFESRAKGVTGIYILSGASITAYLGSMAIKSE